MKNALERRVGGGRQRVRENCEKLASGGNFSVLFFSARFFCLIIKLLINLREDSVSTSIIVAHRQPKNCLAFACVKVFLFCCLFSVTFSWPRGGMLRFETKTEEKGFLRTKKKNNPTSNLKQKREKKSYKHSR